jgi:hypothetical protein
MNSADLSRARWRKSSRTANGANCVELTCTPKPAIRDSKYPTGPVLAIDWAGLISLAKSLPE